MEVLGYDTRDSGHWGHSYPAERQRLERIERTYRKSTVRSEKDRNDLCDALRQAGDILQSRVNIVPDIQEELNIFDRQFYTAEMLHAEAANKARVIDTARQGTVLCLAGQKTVLCPGPEMNKRPT